MVRIELRLLALVLEREAGLLGRQDLGIWCLGVWPSRLVIRPGCSAARTLKPGAQWKAGSCAHLHAIYMCECFEMLTFLTDTLKSTFLQCCSAETTRPESWVQIGQDAQRRQEGGGPAKVLWCSEKRAGWEGCFSGYPDRHLTKIITGKIFCFMFVLSSKVFSFHMFYNTHSILYRNTGLLLKKR